MLTTHNIDIQAMLVWLTLPFYDFCGFWSVAVNTVYTLQFFLHLYYVYLKALRYGSHSFTCKYIMPAFPS